MNVRFASRMPVRAIALALLSLLGACASPPPAPRVAPPQVVVCAPPPAPAAVPAPVPGPVDALLAYQQSLRPLSRVDLQKESATVDLQPLSAPVMLKKAMLLAALRGPGDLARAQQLADNVVRATADDAVSVRALAQLLAATYAELRRQSEQTDKLTQQVQTQQRRIEQLDTMLEGLKAIERKLARPGGAAAGGK